MNVTEIAAGRLPPADINVVIEIPQGSAVKYEIDKASGAVVVDRFLFTPMAYPAAYGFIPGTLAEDGDPADALVLLPNQVLPGQLVPGAVVRARPIGVLLMEDEAGRDEKIICVPHDRIHPQHADVADISDLPLITRQAIEHFFTRYKDLERGKWVKVLGWGERAEAEALVVACIRRARPEAYLAAAAE